MDEAHNMYPNLNDQQQFRLNEINEVQDYLIAENKESELLLYIASFDYFHKSLIVLSAKSGGNIYCIICYCYSSTCRNSKCKF